MNNFEKLKKVLEDNKIEHEFKKLETNDPSVDAHVKALGIMYKQGLSTLIYVTSKGEYIALLRRDDRNVDMEKLEKLAGDKIKFASAEELQKLGFEPGLASPFLLKDMDQPVKVFIDSIALEMDMVICGSTLSDTALKVNKEDIVKFLSNYIEADVTIPNPKRQDKEISTRKINRVLSGITPSGSALHIGNYFGAIKPHIELQNQIDETFYFIADLHALTTIKNKEELENNIINVVLDYLALGLDPKRSTFFRQSDVVEHSQLAVVLANYVSLGQMQRMHAFKDKLQKGADEGAINMGLFNYPILMAADILVYKPDGVPVGEDQKQHVELTRDIAENLNRIYKTEVLPLPEPLISKETGKVIGTDGERKMSKSLGNIIGIFEPEEVIRKQIMSSYTDPNRKKATDPGKVEGNPVFLYHDLINDNKDEVKDLKKRYQEGTVGDVEVKEKLFAAHMRHFGPARERRKELEKDINNVHEILKDGSTRAAKVAHETLMEVYKTIGIKNKVSALI